MSLLLSRGPVALSPHSLSSSSSDSGFFFSVSEISTFFLIGVDLFKTFPFLAERHPVIKQASRVTFAAFFLVVRVLLWLPMSYQFWSDTLTAYRRRGSPSQSRWMPSHFAALFHGGGDFGARKSRAGAAVPTYVYFLFWIANAFLTCLQLFWALKIVRAIVAPRLRRKRGDRRE